MLTSIIQGDITELQQSVSESSKAQRILITGGAGFLGSWLCDTFVASAKVCCYDNLATGKFSNISHLKTNRNFQFKRTDISSKNWTEKQRFDLMLHLASRPSPDDYQTHPVETLRVSTQGTFNMLELARRRDAPILLASTSEVYGDPAVVPTPETYWGNVNPIGIRSCYDEGKRVSEAMFMAYHRQYGLDIRIVRIFNTYGPRIRAKGAYGRAVPRFIVQALSNRPITIFGTGEQTRSFCYVTDTVSAMAAVMLNEKAKGQVFNLGNPSEITILQLAKMITRLIRSKSEIIYEPEVADDPKRRCPDISKIRSILGWNPKVNLEQGLKRTAFWFKENNY